MKNKLLLIMLGFGSIVLAQNVNTKDGGTIYNSQNYVLDKANLNDSFYIDKEYKNANIKNYSGTRGYRYNAFTDDFEYLDGKKYYNLEKQDGLELNFLNGQIYKYTSYYDDNGELKKGYLQVLTDINGNNILYKSVKVSKTELGNTNSYNNMDSVKFRTLINYYIGTGNKIEQVSKSNKDLNKIAKAAKLNISKEKDLIKLVDILNK
ncbi:MAG: hypothetical protein RR578_03230 [Bacilli bacterium]|uniref:hypothetical protein n=1 Tax=Algoriella sp. TaxID=1872434 RepID=UPI002FC862CD